MKYVSIILLLLSVNSFSRDLNGHYQLTKVVCEDSGRVPEMANEAHSTTIDLVYDNNKVKMTTVTNIKKFVFGVPLHCKQVNEGSFEIIDDIKYKGDMQFKSGECSPKVFSPMLKFRKFGVQESLAEYHYEKEGNKLKLVNYSAKNQYPCKEKNDGAAVFYYTKK